MSECDCDDLTQDEQRERLEASGLTVFVSDLRTMFVQEDCGGDLNFYVFDGFASLGPDEVRRLDAVIAARVAQYRTA